MLLNVKVESSCYHILRQSNLLRGQADQVSGHTDAQLQILLVGYIGGIVAPLNALVPNSPCYA